MNKIDLNKLLSQRDSARENDEVWSPSAEDVIAAYNAGWRDFAGANLGFANLSGANLSGAYLREANFAGANLSGANGIFAIESLGIHRRRIYAYVYDGEIRFRIGCRSCGVNEAITAIEKDYADDEAQRDLYFAAIALCERWGNMQLKSDITRETLQFATQPEDTSFDVMSTMDAYADDDCPHCDGTGYTGVRNGDDDIPCPVCQRTGDIPF